MVRALYLPSYAAVVFFLLQIAGLATAQIGSDYSHIPYVPTPQAMVERMLELAKVGPGDFVLDLGSGDGRIPITAAKKYGARGLGVEINPTLVAEANDNARKAGVSDKVSFRMQDLFDTPVGDATVLALYLPVQTNIALRPRLLKEMRPGSRIVSHHFAFGEWEADFRELINTRSIYLWIVPANVHGTWQVTDGARHFQLHLWQTFQQLSGTASIAARHHALQDLLLRGDAIDFAIELDDNERLVFHGKVTEGRIEARAASGALQSNWRAMHVSEKPLRGP
jgi:hypothetical protein